MIFCIPATDICGSRFKRINTGAAGDEYIQCLFEDHAGIVWFGTTEGGLLSLDPVTDRISIFSASLNHPIGFPSDNISAITEDKMHTLWIATLDAGLIHFNPADKSFHHYFYQQGEENTISTNSISHVFNDGDRFIWLSTYTGINRLEISTGKIEHHPYLHGKNKEFFSTNFRQIIRDSNGRLWAGTYDYLGLLLLEDGKEANPQFRHLRHEEDDLSSLISDRIRWLYEDHRHNIWIGTEDGLNKLPAKQPFKQLKYMPTRPGTIGGKVVSSIICPDRDGILWIGYNGGGFDRLETSSGELKHFKPDPSKPGGLSNEDVITLYQDKSGILWIGTSRGGLNRFDPRSGIFRHYRNKPGDSYSLRSDWVQQVMETRQGFFLIGTNDGLQCFDRVTEKFESFKPLIMNSHEFLPEDISVNALFEDRQGEIWIGTWLEGLYRYNPSTKQLFHYMPQRDNPNSISSSKITSIHQDYNGIIWIGTHSGGINSFDKSKGIFTIYTTQNGMPNDVVFGILDDRQGFLWVSTMNGLLRFNPQTGNFRVYDVHDGLIHNQFNWRAFCRTKSGLMYFGGINGLIYFHPDSIRIERIAPPVAFTSFRIFNRETLLRQALNSAHEIPLRHDQNFFSIEYAALDITPQHKHRYAYQLEGIDPDWVQAGPARIAAYTDIDPGIYKFSVMACNADGVWSAPISLSINISPAWWMTWWFKIIIIFILLMLVFSGYKYRIKQLLEIQRIRFGIASDLHDEIGSNLSSISVEAQLLLSSSSLDATEREHLTDIGKTAKETMDAIRDIIWFINPRNDVSEDIIMKLKETANRLLAGLRWAFDISPSIRFDSLNLEVRRNIFLIYKEALTNVVRHSRATTCHIRITSEKGGIRMCISDNGTGFDTSLVQEYSGILNMQRRAQRIKGKIDITSRTGAGTSICLDIPLKSRNAAHQRSTI